MCLMVGKEETRLRKLEELDLFVIAKLIIELVIQSKEIESIGELRLNRTNALSSI